MPSAQERDAEGRTPQSARFFASAAVVRVCILAPRSVNFSRLEPKLEPRRRWDVFLREGNTKKNKITNKKIRNALIFRSLNGVHLWHRGGLGSFEVSGLVP